MSETFRHHVRHYVEACRTAPNEATPCDVDKVTDEIVARIGREGFPWPLAVGYALIGFPSALYAANNVLDLIKSAESGQYILESYLFTAVVCLWVPNSEDL